MGNIYKNFSNNFKKIQFLIHLRSVEHNWSSRFYVFLCIDIENARLCKIKLESLYLK